MSVTKDKRWEFESEEHIANQRIYNKTLDTIDLPESMQKDLKEEAKCKATQALIVQIAQMTEKQLERIQIFPQKILRKLQEIPLEKVPLVSRIIARSIYIDKTNSVLGSIDCELNTVFMHHYVVNLFEHEAANKSACARDWYLEHQFVINFDVQLAKNNHLMLGLDDAIKQGNETAMQLLCTKAGLSVPEIHSLFPKYARRRFVEMQTYCNELKKFQVENESSQEYYSTLLIDVKDNENITGLSFNTIESPESMPDSLKDQAKCIAAEVLIQTMSLMSTEQLERSRIFPEKLLKAIIAISREHIPLVARRLARSIEIVKNGEQESCTDSELSVLFFHTYSLNLFHYEPMKKALISSNWFLENGYSIQFSAEQAKKQRLFAGVKDAIAQVKESFLQLHCIKAGYTINQVHSLFPRHVRGRFISMLAYCNTDREVGKICKITDQDTLSEYRDLVAHYFAYRGDMLESKLLAYNDVIIGDEMPLPITSYEQQYSCQ